jgi:hypothetical protein
MKHSTQASGREPNAAIHMTDNCPMDYGRGCETKKCQSMLLVSTIDTSVPFDVKSKMTIDHRYLNKLS